MSMHHQKGFTIIETLLFLAISAVLGAALLTGWTAMINTQRYNDSIKTVQTFIQQQYTLVYNVQNGRTAMSACVVGPDGRPQMATEDDIEGGTPAMPPGQSSCIIMGRYIHIQGGNTLRVYPIVGVDSTTTSAVTATNKQVILARNPVYVADEQFLAQSELKIPWQAQVVWPQVSPSVGQPMSRAIAIVRNPESGTVHTYIGPAGDTLTSVVDTVSAAAVDSDTNLCLDPGVPMAGGKMGVVIQRGASAGSAVQLIGDSESLC